MAPLIFPITPIILIIPIIPITPIKTQRSCPLLHPRRSCGTHPPPRRGLGGGSGLQLLSLRKAGVEVVSRGDRIFTLPKVLSKMIKPEKSISLFSGLTHFSSFYFPSRSRITRSISSVILSRSHSGFQPHSARAQLSSSELGQLSAISRFTGSM